MEDDQQPTLRIAGYVRPIAKHRAPESPQITWPDITAYWPDSAPQNGAWHGLLPSNAYSISSDDPPTGERSRSWLQRPVVLTGMTAMLVVFGTVLLARPLAHSEITERPVAAPTDVIPLEPMPVASPSPSFSFSLPPVSAAAPPAAPSQSPAAAARTRARLEFVSGVTELSVKIIDLGGDAYRIQTPVGNPVEADVTFIDGVLRIAVKPGSAPMVEVLLSRAIAWHLRLGAGVKTLNFDGVAGTVSRIDLDGGAETINLHLGKPADIIPIRMTAGVGRWVIHTPARVPVRVAVQSGAGNVTIYGRASGGTAPGTVIGAADLADRPALDINATGGIGSLEVKRG